MNNELEQMASKINAALADANYKPAEARAAVWTKEVKPGQTIERIYLSGKKAAGFVHQVEGCWMAEGISFQYLLRVVENAIR